MSDASVVRATRVEIVDDQGRIRAVLGPPADTGPESVLGDGTVGLVVYDVDGRARVWVALESTGPTVSIDAEGDLAVQMGVADAAPDLQTPGAYLVLADAAGSPRAGWSVHRDGRVTTWGA